MSDPIEKDFTIMWKIGNFTPLLKKRLLNKKGIEVSSLSNPKNTILVDLEVCQTIEVPTCIECKLSYEDHPKLFQEMGIKYKIEMLDGKKPIPGIKKYESVNVMHQDFLLEKEEFDEHLKKNNDTVVFLCVLTKNTQQEDSGLKNICNVVSKLQIERECMKTKIYARSGQIFSYSVFPDFDVSLSFRESDVLLDITKTCEDSKKFEGEFRLVCSKGHKILRKVVDEEWEFSKTDDSCKFPKTCNDSVMFFQCCETVEKMVDDGEYKNVSSTIEYLESMRTIYDNKKFSNVIVKVDNKEIKAHKVILAARSPVLAAMFDKDGSNVIEIKDWDPITVENFLYFLYNDELLEYDYKYIIDLLLMAHEFRVESLRAKCISFVMTSLLNNPDIEASFVSEALSAGKKLSSIELETVARFFKQKYPL